uniref:CobW C-terminal domain-containing protein n=1 Tax=Fibrocapsa japonica TaxID=94617 RepID=A0A7S2XTM8_9STRA|mmetsp:Transcript_10939/g.16108  ORF Transcript_10939/g.16108 Transcript_10939/m.16108 type:complete len:126 (+) Transcript_10939:439-816(+)
MGSVVRSKGFSWLASRHDRMAVWEQAGGSFNCADGGYWWASTPLELWPEDKEEVEDALHDYDPDGPFGDRRQEIVFIGSNMNEEALKKSLSACLLDEDEMQLGPEEWKETIDDPFPAWADSDEDI